MDEIRIGYVDCRGQPGKFFQEPVGTPKRIKPAFDIRFFKDVYYLDGELAGAIPTSIELDIIDQRTLVICGTMERAYPNDSRVPPSELAALENKMDAVLQQILGAIKKDCENPQGETAGIGDDILSSEDAQASSDGQSGTDLEVTSKSAFPREKSRQGEGSRQKPRVYIIPQLREEDKGKGPAKGILRKPGSKNDDLRVTMICKIEQTSMSGETHTITLVNTRIPQKPGSGCWLNERLAGSFAPFASRDRSTGMPRKASLWEVFFS